MTNMTLQALRSLVADDAYASSYQSMSHYRGALLRRFDSLTAGANGELPPCPHCNQVWQAPVSAAPDAQPLNHGHRDDFYLLANARRLGLEPMSRVRHMPNWVLAMELFATGSTSAYQICRDAGVNPDSCEAGRAPTRVAHQGEMA